MTKIIKDPLSFSGRKPAIIKTKKTTPKNFKKDFIFASLVV